MQSKVFPGGKSTKGELAAASAGEVQAIASSSFEKSIFILCPPLSAVSGKYFFHIKGLSIRSKFSLQSPANPCISRAGRDHQRIPYETAP